MKNDAQGMAASRNKPADTVAQLHSIITARALHGSIVDGEYDTIALMQRDNNGTRLHPRPLFRHHEFSAGEILFRLRQ